MSNKTKKPVYVTEPFLPPLDEFSPYLEKIWENKQVTNKGPFHEQFEEELCSYLGVKYVSLFCNGTIALLIAMKALRLTGDIITTPYTFVATPHSIKWNGLTPVFVDIERNSCNIDPEKIETAITDKTTGIMPVHVYGIPCNLNRIQEIADKYDLKVVYDAAHGFGVKENGRSILNAGDLSVLSFHGTKVFNTFEGGAIVSHSKEMKKSINDLKNFSFTDEVTVSGLGINGKMNEFQAALGLLQLEYFDEVISRRNRIDSLYRKFLKDVSGVSLINYSKNSCPNYSYFPIFIDKNKFGISRDDLYLSLKSQNIFARRYFYPLVSDFKVYKDNSSLYQLNLNNAKRASNSVLCLPMYPGLKDAEVQLISSLIKDMQK